MVSESWLGFYLQAIENDSGKFNLNKIVPGRMSVAHMSTGAWRTWLRKRQKPLLWRALHGGAQQKLQQKSSQRVHPAALAAAPLMGVVCSCPYICLMSLGQVTCMLHSQARRGERALLIGYCVGGGPIPTSTHSRRFPHKTGWSVNRTWILDSPNNKWWL